MFEALKTIDTVKLNFSDGGLFIMNIAIAIIMFGVALEIKMSHFRELIKKPKPVIVGVISQFILLPFITATLAILFWDNITAGVAMGMILVAACPGGNVSNFISTLAKGNSALSVSLTAISTISAVLMTPFNFYLWGNVYAAIGPWGENDFLKELTIDPSNMFQTVIILLGVPIILGMLTNHYFPQITEKIKKPIRLFSLFFFMGMVVMLFANNYSYFINYIWWILIIVFIHNVIVLSTGYGFAKINKLSIQNRRTIAIETGIQNSGLGLVLLFNDKIFPQDLELGGMMFVVAWWGIWHILSGLTIAGIWRRRPI